MTDPNSPLFWFEFWQEQNATFMKLYQADISLFQHALHNDQWLRDFDTWTETLKALLTQNKTTLHTALHNASAKFLDAKQQKMYENFADNVFEHINSAVDTFHDTVVKNVSAKKVEKNSPNFYEFWQSAYEKSWKDLVNNKSYQKTYGDFINNLMKRSFHPE
jgi:hypothetical protein